MSDTLRLAEIRATLSTEVPRARDGWTLAREQRMARERRTLLQRVTELAPRVEAGRADDEELARLAQDVDHHHQRVNDIAWDEAEVDFGGSE